MIEQHIASSPPSPDTERNFDKALHEEETPDSTELTNDIPFLYPNVQHAMEDLKKISENQAEAKEIQHTASGEPILTSEIIDAWIKRYEF